MLSRDRNNEVNDSLVSPIVHTTKSEACIHKNSHKLTPKKNFFGQTHL